jgi:hypothetical protein
LLVRHRDGIDQVRLDLVGVLVLVDQHVQELFAIARGDLAVLVKQPQRVDEQIVVVHRVGLELAFRYTSRNVLIGPARCEK